MDISRVFLERQIWIVNYYFKSWSKNLINVSINTGVSVVIKTKSEIKCHSNSFSGNTSSFVFITENFWWDFWSNNWRSIFDIVKRLCYYICYFYLLTSSGCFLKTKWLIKKLNIVHIMTREFVCFWKFSFHRRQPSDLFFSKQIRQIKACQNNKYDV